MISFHFLFPTLTFRVPLSSAPSPTFNEQGVRAPVPHVATPLIGYYLIWRYRPRLAIARKIDFILLI